MLIDTNGETFCEILKPKKDCRLYKIYILSNNHYSDLTISYVTMIFGNYICRYDMLITEIKLLTLLYAGFVCIKKYDKRLLTSNAEVISNA